MVGDVAQGAVLPKHLQRGDRIRFVSPASPIVAGDLKSSVAALESFGLEVSYGSHVYDVHPSLDYLAGTDQDRLQDLNDALADSSVRAIIATRGGKGAYRLAAGLDFAAARRDPKLLIGFSEITILHMALLKHVGLTAVHGAAWDAGAFGHATADSFRRAVMSTEPVIVHSTVRESTHTLTTNGVAEGTFIGGNQDSIATGAGWVLPSFDGAILLLEAFNLRLGHIDRQLTMLMKSGIIDRVVAVAVGQCTQCVAATDPTGELRCTEIDVLRDRLGDLQVPILGGLPIGHGERPLAIPIGTRAVLDADTGTLSIATAVR